MTRVAVKVRNASFFTQTRITTLPTPTTDVAEVERAALAVLDRFELTRPVRVLGVRVDLALDEPPHRDRGSGWLGSPGNASRPVQRLASHHCPAHDPAA